MSLEDGRRGYDNEPRRPRYPKELVHRYGAKAGLLLYAARELPDIPQAPMVVDEPGESIEDFLARADAAGIGWPRYFRSSAVAELDGYEGDFLTEAIEAFEVGHEKVKWNSKYYGLFRNQEYFDRYIRRLIADIKTCPQRLKTMGQGEELPDEINVIIAEASPSSHFGTYIKHPNRDGYYLMTITDADTQSFPSEATDCPQRFVYEYTSNAGITFLDNYSSYFSDKSADNPKDKADNARNRTDLATVASWHDRIAALPEMDDSWTYQIEFGINPLCLYQVRPFKPIAKANFQLDELKRPSPTRPLVIGVTSSGGIVARVETNVWQRTTNDEPINPDNQPVVLFEDLGMAYTDGLRNHRANILHHSYGLLAHMSIKTIRHAEVTALYALMPFKLNQGDWVRIISDGVNILIKSF